MEIKKDMQKLQEKIYEIVNNKWIVLLLCTAFVLFAAFYHYGLLSEYPPNCEVIMSISYMYSHLAFGTEYGVGELLVKACSFLATEIGGMSYFSVRLFLTMLYIILLSGTLILCLHDKRGRKYNLYLLPLIALFCIALFPVADNPLLLSDSGAKDLVYLWPFEYHYASRIYVVICCLLVWMTERCKEKSKRIAYGIILAVVFIYALKMTDLMFYVMFAGPAVIVLLLHILQSRNVSLKKSAAYIFCGAMALLLISRFLPIESIRQLWTKEPVDFYGEIYGGTNWGSIDMLGERFLAYIKIVCIIFNIQMPETPVISFYTIVYVLKIVILIVGYLLMFHIIKCSITGERRKYEYDCVDEILAWSYLVLSCVCLFTHLGNDQLARYYPGLLISMVIILCRNINMFPELVKIEWLKKMKYKKVLVCICILVLCACSMGKVWSYRAPNVYDEDLKAAVDYIKGTKYGYALAPYWLCLRASALSEGEVMVYADEGTIKSIHGEDARVTYIITHNLNRGSDDGHGGTSIYDHCNTYEEMCDYYFTLTDIIEFNSLQVVVCKDGIQRNE